MALSLKDLPFTNSARGVVGLDLDGSFMAAVQTSGERISGAVSTDVAAGLMADGEVSDVEALSRAIQAFFKANSLPRRVQLGGLESADRRAAVRVAADCR